MAKKKITSERDERLAAAVDQVRKTLGIETFENRGRDALDFHEMSVRALREAVQIAFRAGYDAGLEDGERLYGGPPCGQVSARSADTCNRIRTDASGPIAGVVPRHPTGPRSPILALKRGLSDGGDDALQNRRSTN